MPKGGDLHNHLSGAVPTEALLGYAVEDGLCIETTTLAATAAPGPGAQCPAGRRPAAAGPPSRRCRAFLRTSAKATVQWRQERRVIAFERRYR